MAEIRKIVRSNPLSAFTQVAPAAGTAFAVLADTANLAYQTLEPLADVEMARRGEEDNRELVRQQVGANSIPVAPLAPAGPDLSTIAPVPQGFSVEGARAAIDRADAQMAGGGQTAMPTGGAGGDRLAGDNWLSYANQSATRNQPLSPQLIDAMSFLQGMGIRMEVFSGGQPAEGPNRVGSTRHDHGNAADVFFYDSASGRRLDWRNSQDVPLFQEIVRQAQARGVTGFGAGDGYMQPGSMHIGFGDPAVWGAEGKGSNAPAWLREAVGGATMTGSAGTPVMAGGAGSDTLAPTGTPPPTMVRTSQGKLEPRLYNPAGGRFAQIYNAAAKMTALSESMLAGQADMMNLSAQMPMDPDGFMQQARAYIDQTVANADPMLRPDLRANLETEMQRRYLGMVDERNDDIRRRAENASGALIDRWSGNYVDALAAGNIPEAQSARAQLEDALYAHESLPGASWTREQSVNVILQAERQSRRVQVDRAAAQTAEWENGFETSIAARKDGMIGAAEYLLDNPAAVAAHPDLAEELAAWTEFQTAMPGFRAMPPGQQRAVVSEMRNVPVSDRYQIAMADKAEEVAAASEKAWSDDAMAYASHLATVSDFPPPPSVPAFDPANPVAFTAALQARRDYALTLRDQGYTRGPVILSNEEAGMIGSQIDGMNSDGKLIIAETVATVLGPQGAGPVFDQIAQDDPAFRFGGLMMAASPALKGTAAKIIRGQDLLDANLATAPDRIAVPENVTAALNGVNLADMGDMPAVVRAYLAATKNSKNATQGEIMSAWQAVLGQSEVDGVTRGGVQNVGRHQVLLPPAVSADDVERALASAFSGPAAETGMAPVPLGGGWMPSFLRATPPTTARPEAWMAAAGSIPYARGEPMSSLPLNDRILRLIPVGQNERGEYIYNMTVDYGDGAVVTVNDERGMLLRVNLDALIEAAR
jgi:hypothetical protein